jgi:hypothetical protein
MRTTIDIDADILLAARELARQRGVPPGKVLSDLARQGLAHQHAGERRNGVPLFPLPPGAAPVTADLVAALRDEAP